ncbi:adenine nucleotide alpha hydrolase family protein [Sandaracinobacteroides hominis]|uniref:hypothetical protein n=1 Tax=Sandaracinobacteroides hominis TaxID=2780086 RepID=UPI0018F297D2|nr:hypothetical protein [Sandaracinobacteroides hominis]
MLQGNQPDLFTGLPNRAPVVVAWGAGTDSTAMILEMLSRGDPIDLVMFADTGDEHPRTYAFIEFFLPWLKDRDVQAEVVRYQPSTFKNWPPYKSLSENCLTNGTLPSIAFGFSSCSQKWKAAPQHTFLKSWEPAQRTWAAGGKVQKLIGYDCSPRDNIRYRQVAALDDPLYSFRYPLREWGWARDACDKRILAEGFPLHPGKSSCMMCTAVKPEELHDAPVWALRRIVLMEARAAPRLTSCEGLWRKAIKGTRTGQPRPGSMTAYIRQQELLKSADIDRIIEMAPKALVRFQDAQASLPVQNRTPLADWLQLFDALDERIFDNPDKPDRYLSTLHQAISEHKADPAEARQIAA